MFFVRIIILIFFLCSVFNNSFGENLLKLKSDVRPEQIAMDIKLIKKIVPEEYLQKIEEVRSRIIKYIDHKKRVCRGEFSTVILSNKNILDGSEAGIKRESLTENERKLCFRELKSLQIELIENMFIVRKKYLSFLHLQQLEELDSYRKKAIEKISRSFSH